MKLVLLGVSGAGKGTQAKILCEHFNIVHISTGDILRQNMRDKTELGCKIQDIMDTGKLVPSELVIDIVKTRLLEEDCKNGYILDGFPRTLYQAQKMEDFADIDKAIYVNVDDKYIIERLTGRLICPDCSQMYHISNLPPLVEGLCDKCNSRLIQREDDKAETVIGRLELFHELTEPIISHYRTKGLLLEVSGLGKVEEISSEIINGLKGIS